MFKVVAVTVEMNSSRTWALVRRDEQKIQCSDMGFLKRNLGCSILDSRRNSGLCQ